MAVFVGLLLLALGLALGGPHDRLAWGLCEFGIIVFGDGAALPRIANLAGMLFYTNAGDDERALRLLYSAPRVTLRFAFAAVLAVFSSTLLFHSSWWDAGTIVGLSAYTLLMMAEIIRAYRSVTSRSTS